MRKFECNYCTKPCVLTFDSTSNNVPRFCPYLTTQPTNWHEVKDGNTQVNTQVELPDWVKVGASVYNIEKKQYRTIRLINGTVTCKNIDSEGCTQYGYGAFMSDCVEARKRPFNADEMKELVGKVITDEDSGNAYLINQYYSKKNEVKFNGFWLTNEELMNNDNYTINGKPCFKLEHLNEKGEWVE